MPNEQNVIAIKRMRQWFLVSKPGGRTIIHKLLGFLHYLSASADNLLGFLLRNFDCSARRSHHSTGCSRNGDANPIRRSWHLCVSACVGCTERRCECPNRKKP